MVHIVSSKPFLERCQAKHQLALGSSIDGVDIFGGNGWFKYWWCRVLKMEWCGKGGNLCSRGFFMDVHREPNPQQKLKHEVIFIIKSDRKWMLLLNNCYKIVSGHFFAICIFIFHKMEVQMVILSCLTGLNHNWFKSYGLRFSRRPRASSGNFWKIASDKWPFYDHIWPFFWKLHDYLWQNWDLDGHFEVLYESKS